MAREAAKRAKKFGKAAMSPTNRVHKAMVDKMVPNILKSKSQKWAQMGRKARIKQTVKEHMRDTLRSGIKKLACEEVIGQVFDSKVDTADWITSVDYPWGSGRSGSGRADLKSYVETVDITGVVGLIGIFFEADCAAQEIKESGVVTQDGNGCPR
jgi:hypothetical protein